MHETFFYISIGIYALCIITHILPLFIDKRRGFGLAGALLHSVLLVTLLLAGASLSLVLVLYMSSIAVHSSAMYIEWKRRNKK
jgi:uncharacterized membrane protein